MIIKNADNISLRGHYRISFCARKQRRSCLPCSIKTAVRIRGIHSTWNKLNSVPYFIDLFVILLLFSIIAREYHLSTSIHSLSKRPGRSEKNEKFSC